MILQNRQIYTLLKSWLKNFTKFIIRARIKANSFEESKQKGIVVLCYLGEKIINNHTSSDQQAILVSLIKKQGYEVKLIPHDSVPIGKINCDYVIGFGIAWRFLSKKKNVKKILYATEAPPFLSYLNEARAVQNAKSKNLQRAYNFYYDDDYLLADEILQMGEFNVHTLRSIQAFNETPIYKINTYGIGFSLDEKIKNKINRGFIWFGSHGVIHKGLNKVLDAFTKIPEAEIYVAGCSESDFLSLKPPTNAIFVGMQNVNSPEFQNIVEKCIAFILPSASEGISTAAITCMYRGLIPIVTRETNVEIPFGKFISNTVNDISSAIHHIYDESDESLIKMSKQTSDFSRQKYSPDSYKESALFALNNIFS